MGTSNRKWEECTCKQLMLQKSIKLNKCEKNTKIKALYKATKKRSCFHLLSSKPVAFTFMPLIAERTEYKEETN